MRQRMKSIIWGLLFFAGAAFIVLMALGVLEQVSVAKIIFAIIFAGIAITSIPYANYFGIIAPIAGICIMFAKEWGIEKLSPWPIVGIAACLIIGCYLIFKPARKKKVIIEPTFSGENHERSAEYSTEYINNGPNNSVSCGNTFSSSVKYIKLENLQSASLRNTFGELTVYFDGSRIPSGSATINVDNKFGELNIYIPRDWRLTINASAALGSINEVNQGQPVEGSPELIIDGSVAFGELDIFRS